MRTDVKDPVQISADDSRKLCPRCGKESKYDLIKTVDDEVCSECYEDLMDEFI